MSGLNVTIVELRQEDRRQDREIESLQRQVKLLRHQTMTLYDMIAHIQGVDK